MSSDTPARDFLKPRVAALVKEAIGHGIARDVAVAVLIDIITAPGYDTAAPDPDADSAPHPDYERAPDVVLVHDTAMNPPHVPGAQDEDDFIRPLRWDQ